VETFLLEVEEHLTSLPEPGCRRTQCYALQAAADAIDEPELGAMIQSPAGLLAEDARLSARGMFGGGSARRKVAL
jgi:hypothetical protein